MKKKVIKRKNSFIRKKRGGIRIFVLCVLVIAALVLGITMFFKIGGIQVEGEIRYTAEEIIEKSGIKKGDNIFTINPAESERKIKEAFPYVENVEIKRVFPDKIVIAVESAKEAVYTRSDDEKWLILNGEGRLLDITEKHPNLPELIGAEVTANGVGKLANFRDETTLGIFKMLWDELEKAEIEDKVTEINLSKRYNLTFDYSAQVMVNLGNTDNLAKKIAFAKISITENLVENEKGEVKFSDNTAKTANYRELTDDEWIDLKLSQNS